MKKMVTAVLAVLVLLSVSSCMLITGEENSPPLTVLKPTIELSAASIKPGDTLTVTIGEWNPAAENVKAPAGNNWPLANLTDGPCGTLNNPMGMAFYAGYYDESNVASAKALLFYDNTGIYHCPGMLSGITYYLFKSDSNTADVYTVYSPQPEITDLKVSTFIFLKGFWTDGVLNPITPGVYTVACGDEWGNLTLAHFTVLGE